MKTTLLFIFLLIEGFAKVPARPHFHFCDDFFTNPERIKT